MRRMSSVTGEGQPRSRYATRCVVGGGRTKRLVAMGAVERGAVQQTQS